jgi:aminoglycoside phosphotransferase (APT) family kinase protein
MIALDKPFAVGRTAEIYAWGEGQVLKLYRDWCPPRWVDFEARIGRIVQDAGLPVPAIGDVVEVNGRRGLVYERLEGLSVFNTLIARPWTIIRFGRLMAELHAAMHAIQAPSDLPGQRDRLKGAIERAQALPADLKRKTLGILETLPDGDRLCHGDFHPDNVLMTPRGPIIIDWMTATRGDPLGDVARTVLLMTVGEPPTGALIRLLTRLLRGWMRAAYLKRYCELRPVGREQLNRWQIVTYAARLAEDIKGEAEQLIPFIERETRGLQL